MTPLRFAVSCLLVAACAPVPAAPHVSGPASQPIAISLKHGSSTEKATSDQLLRLLAHHDLTPWEFTRQVIIDDDAIPHSHPVLTLHARHLLDDTLLLSTFIHEQSHWCFQQNPEATAACVAELQQLVPGLPVGYPDGANDLRSSYEHLLVIAFEWKGLRHYLGELEGRQAMEFWATDHYRAVYKAVLEDPKRIWEVLSKHHFQLPVAGPNGPQCRTH